MSLSILVVDDDSETLDLVDNVCEEHFAAMVYSYSNSKMALKFLQRKDASRIDLIICELVMSGVSGMELLAQARRKGLSAPVILISSEVTREHAIKAKQLGAVAFIVKPFMQEDLIDKISKALTK